MAASNRYSRAVSWGKVILPLLALGLLSTLFLFSGRPDPDLALPLADVDIAELTRDQRLTDPRFAGLMEDGREIVFRAARAAPVAENPRQFTADRIEARLALSGFDFIVLESDLALVDLEANAAELTQNVHIRSTSGYQLDTGLLTLSLARMALNAPGEVRVTGPRLNLQAGSMDLTGEPGQQVLIFNGGVRVLYSPEN